MAELNARLQGEGMRMRKLAGHGVPEPCSLGRGMKRQLRCQQGLKIAEETTNIHSRNEAKRNGAEAEGAI